MKCIIIEDEPAAQTVLKNHISHYPGLLCSGTFSNAFDARVFLDNHETDLIFLDINLPEISGVSFLRSLLHPPLVIFTTAYSQYAIDGFDFEIVDFLLKPFSLERFCRAVDKAKEKLLARHNLINHQESITVKSDRKLYQINISDIVFIESCGDYVLINLKDKKLIVHGTLKSWEDKLQPHGFLKVHRTAIVNRQKIDHIDGNMVHTNSHKIPLSEPFKTVLLRQL